MKAYEQFYEDIMDDVEKLNDMIYVKKRLLSESATYYELRSFISLLLKSVHKKETKDVLSDILLSLGKLEIMNKPAPTIKKLKSKSPNIF